MFPARTTGEFMNKNPRLYSVFFLLMPIFFFSGAGLSLSEDTVKKPANEEADIIMRKAFDHMRGKTSGSLVEMTVHRPSWDRRMIIKGWTRGQSDALFFIDEPPKDAGNGTLKLGQEMWTYNPKINRVIKLPPSMMSQSWMGSDFSNNDLAKSDSVINDYVHSLTKKETRGKWTFYTVNSVPRVDAPVIWGRMESEIREDGIFFSQAFFDEDGVKVKEMVTKEIGEIGGRLFPREWIMKKSDDPDSLTRIVYKSLEFDLRLPDDFFRVSNLSGQGKK